MALNLPGVPFKLTGADVGSPDYAGSLMSGLQGGESSYLHAPMMIAQIQKLKGEAQKNAMLSNLYGALMGQGNSGESGGLGEHILGPNWRKAIIKGLLGIDPDYQTPSEIQQLKIKEQTEAAANKANLTTGASDIARESLQGIVSMPKEYLGWGGSLKMGFDRFAAQNGDKDAKERLIQAAVAEKLVPEYSGFQLMSQGQRATVPALQHQQAAIRQGWPYLSHTITDNLTPDLQKEVDKRHNKAVRKVNKLRENFLKSGGSRDMALDSGEKNKIFADEIPQATEEDKQDAVFFNTTPSIIAMGRKKGIKSIKGMREYIDNLE